MSSARAHGCTKVPVDRTTVLVDCKTTDTIFWILDITRRDDRSMVHRSDIELHCATDQSELRSSLELESH